VRIDRDRVALAPVDAFGDDAYAFGNIADKADIPGRHAPQAGDAGTGVLDLPFCLVRPGSPALLSAT
jgi:hypothetical protein